MPLELIEPADKPGRGVAGLLAESLPPGFRRSRHTPPREHAVGHVDRPQRPGDAIVLRLDPQVVEQDVETLSAVRLRGGGVPITVFGMVFGHALQHEPQPRRRLLHRERSGDQVFHEPLGMPRRRRIGNVGLGGEIGEVLQPVPYASPEDAPQRRRCQQVLGEQAGPIPLDELAGRGKGLVVAEPLEHREPELAGVGHPGLE